MNRSLLNTFLVGVAVLASGTAHATGRMTCDSGDKSNWKSEAQLIQKITAEGWTVRKVKDYGVRPNDAPVALHERGLTVRV